MIKTIISLILLLILFLLILNFKNRKAGFFYVLSFLIAGNLALAVLTQALGIFRYSVILAVFIIADFIILLKTDFKNLLNYIRKIKIDWIFLIVLFIAFLSLYSVHYNYTGKIATINGVEEVKNMKYLYPYFSDEWSSAAFAKYSISSGKLPMANPLWHNEFFVNLAFPFHAFASQVILFLDLNPLTQYYLLPLFAGILICALIYFILRLNNAGKIASGISALSVLYIANAATLAGIWYFIPIVMGIILMLLSFLFFSIKDNKMTFFNAFLSLIFYPPLIVFYPVLFFLRCRVFGKTKLLKLIFLFLVVFFFSIGFFILLQDSHERKITFDLIKSKFYSTTIYKTLIPNFPIYRAIPVYVLVLAFFGFILNLKSFKEKLWLIAPIFTGLIFWIIYSKVLWRVIIEYDRVVLSTSILMVILAGFGIDSIISCSKKKDYVKKYRVVEIAAIIIFTAFFIMSFYYTQRDYWEDFSLKSTSDSMIFKPEPPANAYLHPADLELFKKISEKNFLSLSWKGLVIGTATDNYPLVTKASTITNVYVDSSKFFDENCANKLEIAKENSIVYVYSREISCPGFELVNISIEGLYLYKINI